MLKSILFLIITHFCNSVIGQTSLEQAIEFLNRGDKNSDSGLHLAAIDEYNKAIELNPEYSQAFLRRGEAKVTLGLLSDAILDFNMAIKLNPNLSRSYLGRGYCRTYHTGEYREAIFDFNKGIELDNNISIDIYLFRAEAKASLKLYYSALTDINRAIDSGLKTSTAYYKRAGIYGWIEENDKAILDYNKALELDPNFTEAYTYRGMSKAKLDDIDGACLDWKKALELGNTEIKEYISEFCK